MDCENQSCHCQSEVALERDGHLFCSDACVSEAEQHQDPCRCGHAGCPEVDAVTARRAS